MKLLSRLQNLVRGLLAGWIGRKEHENPEAVYEAAIEERTRRYTKLREAAAGVLYLRTKLTRELEQKTRELARVRKQLEAAVDGDDDEAALALIRRREALESDVERLHGELKDVAQEADAAKQNLSTFHEDLSRLRDERVRIVARLANAKARLRLHETIGGISPDADTKALDAVRDYVNRLLQEVQLSRELNEEDLRRRSARDDGDGLAAARAELDRLKGQRRRRLLPLVVAAPVETGAAH